MAQAAKRGGAAAGGVTQDRLRGLLGYNLKRGYMHVHRGVRVTLEAQGFTLRTFSVLSVVVENPGISQSEIARTLEIERSGTVVIVDELEARGLLGRAKMPGDRRAYALSATPEGTQRHEAALAALTALEDRMFTGLTPEERATLQALLIRIQTCEEDHQA